MGMVIYRVGDIFEAMRSGQHHVMAHGCNCFNTMGSGIAPLVARECPEAEQVDKATIKGSISKLGNLTYGKTQYEGLDHPSYFMNLYTQHHWDRRKSFLPMQRAVSYDAVEQCALAVRSRLISTPSLSGIGETTFCMPLIGAGLAGGDWDIIIQLFSKHIDAITVYVLPNEEGLSTAFGEDFRKLVFPYFTKGGKWMLARFSKYNDVVTLGGAVYHSAADAEQAARNLSNRQVKEGLVLCA